MKPKIYPAKEHGISHENVNADALFIIHRLKEEGHEAYLVGGGVRDLLAGLEPKDFDISTSAPPEEVKRIFRRRCLLIGRRFRLAHVRCGQHVLEVSTFRSGDIDEADLILRDNNWGTAEEDVLRRDFTINGLFYDPEDETIIDYVGGVDDLERGVLRTIGVPAARFCQDPVRMIRLLKFRARFGFSVDTETEQALAECHKEILKSSPARVLEEMFRMLESTAAEPFFRLMHENGFLRLLFPWLASFLNDKTQAERVFAHLKALDELQKAPYRGIYPRPVLACCLTYPILEYEFARISELSEIPLHLGHVMDLSQGIVQVVAENSFSQLPRRIRALMHYAMSTQYRLTPPFKARIRKDRISNQRDFAIALNFLRIRAEVDPSIKEMYDEWKQRWKAHKSDKKPKRRTRTRRSKPTS